MDCSCLVNRHTHTDNCPVTVENRKALRALEANPTPCKGCGVAVTPDVPLHHNDLSNRGPFYCAACSWVCRCRAENPPTNTRCWNCKTGRNAGRVAQSR